MTLDNTFGRVIILAAGRIIVKSVEWKEKKKIITRWCCCCVLPFCSVQFSSVLVLHRSVLYFHFGRCWISVESIWLRARTSAKRAECGRITPPSCPWKKIPCNFRLICFLFLIFICFKNSRRILFFSFTAWWILWLMCFLFFISYFLIPFKYYALAFTRSLRAPIKKSRNDFSQRNRVNTIDVDIETTIKPVRYYIIYIAEIPVDNPIHTNKRNGHCFSDNDVISILISTEITKIDVHELTVRDDLGKRDRPTNHLHRRQWWIWPVVIKSARTTTYQ